MDNKLDKQNYNKKTDKKVRKNLFFSSAIFAFVLIMIVVGQVQLSNPAQETFGSGTYINGQSVSGYTVNQASQIVADKMKEQVDGISIQIMYKDKIWKFNQDDFEIDGAVKQVVQNAYDSYTATKVSNKSSNLSNSKILNSISSNNTAGSYRVSLKSTFKNFDQKIQEIVDEIETEPQNAKVEFNPDSTDMFNVVEGVNGVKVDTDKLYTDLENQFLRTKDIKVYVNTTGVKPEIEASYYDNKLNLMSKFSTTLKDSQEGRRHNVNLALKKFNGGTLIRLYNSSDKPQKCSVIIGKTEFAVSLSPFEVKTFIGSDGKITEPDMLGRTLCD